jgi:hypothetical protein
MIYYECLSVENVLNCSDKLSFFNNHHHLINTRNLPSIDCDLSTSSRCTQLSESYSSLLFVSENKSPNLISIFEHQNEDDFTQNFANCSNTTIASVEEEENLTDVSFNSLEDNNNLLSPFLRLKLNKLNSENNHLKSTPTMISVYGDEKFYTPKRNSSKITNNMSTFEPPKLASTPLRTPKTSTPLNLMYKISSCKLSSCECCYQTSTRIENSSMLFDEQELSDIDFSIKINNEDQILSANAVQKYQQLIMNNNKELNLFDFLSQKQKMVSSKKSNCSNVIKRCIKPFKKLCKRKK